MGQQLVFLIKRTNMSSCSPRAKLPDAPRTGMWPRLVSGTLNLNLVKQQQPHFVDEMAQRMNPVLISGATH